MRSGFVDLNRGYLGYTGSSGVDWSGSADFNSDFARYLDFNPTGVNPSNNYYRYLGFSLRCLQE